MKIKIVSDGTVKNTQVIDMETGKPLKNVTCVDWHLDVKEGVSKATITFQSVPFEFTEEKETP